MKKLDFKIDASLEQKLRFEAEKNHMNMSEFIRHIIREHLTEKKDSVAEEVSKLGKTLEQMLIAHKGSAIQQKQTMETMHGDIRVINSMFTKLMKSVAKFSLLNPKLYKSLKDIIPAIFWSK